MLQTVVRNTPNKRKQIKEVGKGREKPDGMSRKNKKSKVGGKNNCQESDHSNFV